MSEPTIEPRAVTPVFGWHVPVLGDVPNIPSDLNSLALGIEATLGNGPRDTGWRSIAGSLGNGWAAATIEVRRVGVVCMLGCYYLSNPSGAPSATIIGTHLSGFGCRQDAYAHAVNADTPASTVMEFIVLNNKLNPSGMLSRQGAAYAANRHLAFDFTWITDDTWPTTLPGTPASANRPSPE